jgi:hypothetical protein
MAKEELRVLVDCFVPGAIEKYLPKTASATAATTTTTTTTATEDVGAAAAAEPASTEQEAE